MFHMYIDVVNVPVNITVIICCFEKVTFDVDVVLKFLLINHILLTFYVLS